MKWYIMIHNALIIGAQQPSYSYVELVVIHAVMGYYIFLKMFIIIVGYRWMCGQCYHVLRVGTALCKFHDYDKI